MMNNSSLISNMHKISYACFDERMKCVNLNKKRYAICFVNLQNANTLSITTFSDKPGGGNFAGDAPVLMLSTAQKCNFPFFELEVVTHM